MDSLEEFRKGLIDSIQGISILLVFLIAFFEMKRKQIEDDLKMKRPNQKLTQELDEFKRKIDKKIINNLLPLIIAFGLLFYLLLPASIEIITNFHISFFYFDLLVTLFLFIEIFSFVFLGYLIYYLIKLLDLRNSE
jgi:O-antigen ligase